MDFKICRLCLKKTPIAYSLTETERAKYLYEVAQIKIDESDIFPKQACISCWQSLKYAYNIRENILKSDRNLKKISLLAEPDENGYVTEENILASIEDVFFSKESEPEKIENIKDKISVPKKDKGLSNNELESNIINSIFHQDPLSTEYIKLENHTDQPLVLLVVDDQDKKASKRKKPDKSLCTICGKKILEINKMEHIQNHFKMMTKCEICEFECELSNYRMHMRTAHTLDLKEVYTCIVCKATFQYNCLFQIHREKAHFGIDFNETYINNFQKKIGIKLNRRAARILLPKAEKYKCEICDKEFLEACRWKLHMHTHALNQCSICGKMIKGRSNLKQHIESHSDKRVVCSICGRPQKDLRSHMYAVHSKKIYRCEHCERTYPLAYRLKLHIKKMHQGKRDFTCEKCDKKFFTQFTLKKHIQMVHLKMRTHQCQYCQKAFASRWGMRTHERQHTGVHPYICEICGKGFAQNVSLKTHMKSTHQTGKVTEDDSTQLEDFTQDMNSTEDDNYGEVLYKDYNEYDETEYENFTTVC